MKNLVKRALVVSGIFLLLLILKTGHVSQNKHVLAQELPDPFPTSTPQPEKPIDEVVVVFNKKPTTSVLLNLASLASEVKPEHGIASSNAMVFSVQGAGITDTITKLSANQNVEAVFPNHPLKTMKVTNDTEISRQWNLFNLKLADQGNSAWNITAGSANVSVTVIDTGVDSTHPDLVGKLGTLVDCSGSSCIDRTTQGMSDPDGNGHGTHVTGLVAAATDNAKGVAGSGFNTKVTVIKIMDATGTITISSLFNALVWAADHGAKVINMSVGQLEENLDAASINEINQKINYAWGKGALLVAAAGNCGRNDQNSDCAIIDGQGNPTGYASNSKVYPAASPNVLSVAALTKGNTLASYSEHNDETNPKVGKWVSVAAPGGECNPNSASDLLNCILSTIPQGIIPTPPPPSPTFPPYFVNMGTSMASPQVAGVAALVLAVNPNLSNVQLKTLIEATADKSVGGTATNYGAVNALAAVTAASSGGEPSVTPGGPTVTNSPPPPDVSPTAYLYPTIPPRMRNVVPSPFPTGPYCSQTYLPSGNCTIQSKNQGDANCDGVVNALDFSLWLNQLDQMVAPQPVNQNANFSCVEGNIPTYFVDLVDYEIWRRNTAEGLVTPIPSPGPVDNSPAPGGPSPTPGGPSPTPGNLASCVNRSGSCITACIRVNNGRAGGMTEFTSSDVTIHFNDYIEFKPEPLDGNSANLNTPRYSPAQQCSALPAAGQVCPAHLGIYPDHGEGSGNIEAFRPLGGEWWRSDPSCKDTLNLTIVH